MAYSEYYHLDVRVFLCWNCFEIHLDKKEVQKCFKINEEKNNKYLELREKVDYDEIYDKMIHSLICNERVVRYESQNK